MNPSNISGGGGPSHMVGKPKASGGTSIGGGPREGSPGRPKGGIPINI